MTERAFWHRLAEEDLTEAYLHIAADSPVAAERWLDAVEGAVQSLVGNPGAGRFRNFQSAHARGLRSWAIKEFHAYQPVEKLIPVGARRFSPSPSSRKLTEALLQLRFRSLF